MGRYIGGPARKHGELRENGAQPVLQPKTFAEVPSGKALIVLVDNGPFDAAGWVFDEREFKEFTDPTDSRPRSFWLMDLEVAKELTGTA